MSTSVAFSPDGGTLASGSRDQTIRLWDAVTGGHQHTLKGHMDVVLHVAFNPAGGTLASVSWDDTIRLWNAGTGASEGIITMDSVRGFGFSPDGRTLGSVGWDENLHLWDGVTGEHRHTLKGHTGTVRYRSVQSGWTHNRQWWGFV